MGELFPHEVLGSHRHLIVATRQLKFDTLSYEACAAEIMADPGYMARLERFLEMEKPDSYTIYSKLKAAEQRMASLSR